MEEPPLLDSDTPIEIDFGEKRVEAVEAVPQPVTRWKRIKIRFWELGSKAGSAAKVIFVSLWKLLKTIFVGLWKFLGEDLKAFFKDAILLLLILGLLELFHHFIESMDYPQHRKDLLGFVHFVITLALMISYGCFIVMGAWVRHVKELKDR